jgi:diguanylate cyclase (GGDEF)-like protein/PAS domain S-box-containing protein
MLVGTPGRGERDVDEQGADSAVSVSPDRVLDGVPAAVVSTDVGGVVLSWNQGAERLYGWTAAEAVGRGINELTLPNGWEPTAVLDSVAGGRSWSGAFTARHRDGHSFRASVTTTPVLDDQGTVLALVGVSTRLVDEPPLDRVQRELAAIVDSSVDAIIGVDVEGVITSWNPAAVTLYGWTAAEVVGTPILSLLPQDQAQLLRGLFAELVVGAVVPDRETTGWRKDGSSFAVDLRLSAVRDREGEVVGYSGLSRDISERSELRRVAEAEGARLRAAQALAHVGSCELDLSTGATHWSDESWRMLGVPPEPGASFDRFVDAVHPEDQAQVQGALELISSGHAPEAQEYRVVRPDGEVRWIREVFAVDHDTTGRASTVLGTKLDITDIRAAVEGRAAAEGILRQGFEHSAIGMLLSDQHGRTTTVNAAYLKIAGRTESELLGAPSSSWVHPEDAETAARPRAAMLRGELDTYSHEHRVLRPDGTVRWVHKTVSLIRGSDGEPALFLGQVQDITARKQVESELAHQAFHDPLTALPNRALLTDRITQALARRSAGAVTALFLDVDQFKVVNDSIGHAAGDELLVLVAQRLQAVVRPGDTLARFGGDEFVIVCDGMAEADVELLGARVAEAVRAPFALDGREVTVTVSGGIATAGAGCDAESLLRNADAAMYQAKARGRNCVVVFDDAMHRQATERLDTELQLRHALGRGELVVHYQPLLELPSGRVTGVEALVRWQHPVRGLLTPAAFMELAESTGLVVDIGEWVLETALVQVQRWRTSLPGGAGLTVAVNLSARQVATPDLTGVVRRVLDSSGIDPAAVHLEITESVVMNDGAVYVDVLTDLRALGVGLSVDDFGTGYSSLSYLKRLPVDTLKIDRSFVDGLGGGDPHDRSIVVAVLSLAAALGLQVVAEGVETAAQLHELVALGVRSAQGYLWKRPAAADELAPWLVERTQRAGR